MVANDHWLKAAAPGWVTGKVSDVAGLVLAPLVLQAAWELALHLVGRPWGPSVRTGVGAALLVGAVFAAINLMVPAADAYRVILGVVQWPFAAIASLVGSGTVPPFRQVTFVRDPGDLVTMPALLLPIALARWRGKQRGSHEADRDHPH